MSAFTNWLRTEGYAHLAPMDDEARPLTSRVTILVERGATPKDVELLRTLWKQWAK